MLFEPEFAGRLQRKGIKGEKTLRARTDLIKRFAVNQFYTIGLFQQSADSISNFIAVLRKIFFASEAKKAAEAVGKTEPHGLLSASLIRANG